MLQNFSNVSVWEHCCLWTEPPGAPLRKQFSQTPLNATPFPCWPSPPLTVVPKSPPPNGLPSGTPLQGAWHCKSLHSPFTEMRRRREGRGQRAGRTGRVSAGMTERFEWMVRAPHGHGEGAVGCLESGIRNTVCRTAGATGLPLVPVSGMARAPTFTDSSSTADLRIPLFPWWGDAQLMNCKAADSDTSCVVMAALQALLSLFQQGRCPPGPIGMKACLPKSARPLLHRHCLMGALPPAETCPLPTLHQVTGQETRE